MSLTACMRPCKCPDTIYKAHLAAASYYTVSTINNCHTHSSETLKLALMTTIGETKGLIKLFSLLDALTNKQTNGKGRLELAINSIHFVSTSTGTLYPLSCSSRVLYTPISLIQHLPKQRLLLHIAPCGISTFHQNACQSI